jgi:uncharacterized protein (DUF4415 family)
MAKAMTNRKHEDEEEFADRIDWTQAQQGAKHPLPPGKERITIRLDEDVLAWFRNQVAQTGGLYQTRINEVLRAHMLGSADRLEATLRKVVREELDRGPAKARKAARAGASKSKPAARKRKAP